MTSTRQFAAIMLVREPSPEALAAGDRNSEMDEGEFTCYSLWNK